MITADDADCSTVVGCPDFEIPRYAWFERTSTGKAVIGCQHSEDRWRLVCLNHTWIGGNTATNCSLRMYRYLTVWLNCCLYLFVSVLLDRLVVLLSRFVCICCARQSGCIAVYSCLYLFYLTVCLYCCLYLSKYAHTVSVKQEAVTVDCLLYVGVAFCSTNGSSIYVQPC